MTKASQKKGSGYGLFLWVPFSILIAFVGGSLLWSLVVSFTQWPGYGPLQQFLGFRNYERIFADTDFWTAFSHAFILILPMSIVPTVVGVFIASLTFDFLSTRYTTKLATFIRSSLYLPQIIPVMITGIIWRWIIDPSSGSLNMLLKSLGLKDLALNWMADPTASMLALSFVLVWMQLGYTVVVFLSGLSRLNPYVLEAAHMDGANWWQRFRFITSRELGPEIAVILLTTVIGALKVFAPVYYVTGGGPDGATNVPSTYSFQAFFGGNKVGYASAVTLILATVIVLFAMIIIRFQRTSLRGEE